MIEGPDKKFDAQTGALRYCYKFKFETANISMEELYATGDKEWKKSILDNLTLDFRMALAQRIFGDAGKALDDWSPWDR